MTMTDNLISSALAPVSVVIPCYDCGDTIERAVKSVVDQSRRPAELILVLDGPNDSLLKTLEALRSRYGEDWIRIVALDSNSGPSAARNTGWDVSSQHYIAFLDADDAWHLRKIEIQLDYMETHRGISLTGHRCRLLGTTKAPASIPEQYRVKHPSNTDSYVAQGAALPFYHGQTLLRGLSVMGADTEQWLQRRSY